MGNNDRHFWRSSEQHRSFKDQGNLSLTHIMVKVGLLIGNKDILSNYFSKSRLTYFTIIELDLDFLIQSIEATFIPSTGQ